MRLGLLITCSLSLLTKSPRSRLECSAHGPSSACNVQHGRGHGHEASDGQQAIPPAKLSAARTLHRCLPSAGFTCATTIAAWHIDTYIHTHTDGEARHAAQRGTHGNLERHDSVAVGAHGILLNCAICKVFESQGAGSKETHTHSVIS